MATHSSVLAWRIPETGEPGGLPSLMLFPSPGDLPNPGIKPRPPALQADFLPRQKQKEINPEYSLEGLTLKLKLQYFGYWM